MTPGPSIDPAAGARFVDTERGSPAGFLNSMGPTDRSTARCAKELSGDDAGLRGRNGAGAAGAPGARPAGGGTTGFSVDAGDPAVGSKVRSLTETR